MKITFSVLLSIVVLSVSAQTTFEIDPDTKLLTAQEIIKLDSMSAEDIYNKGKEWISVKRIKHPYDRIEADDTGVMIRLNYVSKYYGMLAEGEYWNVLTIQVKDGKAKITIDNILLGDRSVTIEAILYKSEGTLKTGKNNLKLYEDIKLKTSAVIGEIKQHLQKKDNW